MALTLADRAWAYAHSEFGQKYPASRLTVVTEQKQPVLYGRWVIGNDYRNKSRYYGAFPNGFLPRLMGLFPDVANHGSTWRTQNILHAFSGSLPEGFYQRCDSHQPAELRCRIEDIAKHAHGLFELVIADPPYSDTDAEKYGTPMIQRAHVTAALAKVTKPGGHLAWLDCVWPMHKKSEWRTVGRIAITRSTNHRVRDLTLFERQAA